jgi:hypothetical protein
MADQFIVSELTADERRWTAKPTELETEALPSLRASAETWAAALTGGLGVVGLAALIKGPEAFKAVEGSQKDIAEGLFFAAAGAALIATALATLAAQRTVKSINSTLGPPSTELGGR